MPPVSDLIKDSKLETEFCPGYTQHVYYVSGVGARQRKIRKEERWERGRSLGAGGFGIVWLEKSVTENGGEKHRAVKEIRKTVQSSEIIQYGRELEAFAKFSHQKYEMCFAKSFGWYESNESVFIAMEYFPFGDLQNYLSSPLLEKEAQQITSQILEGLSFMHDNGFAHRDLKPANILVKSRGPDWWVKIGDFGVSKRAEEGLTALRTLHGTLGFLAPEILVQLKLFDLDDGDFEAGEEYSAAVDIWALGEITFRALTGEQPFPIRSLRAYIQGSSPFPVEILQAHSVSKGGCDFLKNLMTVMPKDRLSARDALSHIWIEPQKPLSAGLSTEMQRSSPTTEEAITSPGYPTTEASARWSTLDVPMVKSNILVNQASTGKSPATPQTQQSIISRSPDGKMLASDGGGGEDGTVRLWDPATGPTRRTLWGHSSCVWAVAFSLDGKMLASGAGDGTVRLWCPATGTTRRVLRGHSSSVWAVIFSPDGKILASGGRDGIINLWNPATGTILDTLLRGHSDCVRAVTFSPDGKILASAGNDGSVRLWDPATGATRRILRPHSSWVEAARRKLLENLCWVEAARRKLLEHLCWVEAVAFSPDGKMLASGGRDGIIRLWDPATGTTLGTLRGHSDCIRAVTFSPDGKILASASNYGSVRLWDPATGTTLSTLRGQLRGHSDWIYAVAFSPDGKMLASGAHDGTVRLWDPATEAAENNPLASS